MKRYTLTVKDNKIKITVDKEGTWMLYSDNKKLLERIMDLCPKCHYKGKMCDECRRWTE